MVDLTVTTLPTAVAEPLSGLEALAAMLQCVDPQRWDSLARPHAAGLAAIVHLLVGELAAGLAEALPLA